MGPSCAWGFSMRLKPPQIAVIAIALGAGGLALMLMGGRGQQAAQQVAAPVRETIAATEVLVARDNVPPGRILSENDLEWRKWPEGGAIENFITRNGGSGGNGLQDAVGSVARTAFTRGEPIQQTRLIKGGRGFMSAILTPGLRAVSAPVEDPSRGAGSFILPNDRVDVILARRTNNPSSAVDALTHQSMTVLNNVRVLAVEQISEEDHRQRSEKTITGRNVTLELTPQQAETLALARELGTLSLALRSIADQTPQPLAGADAEDEQSVFGGRGTRVTIVRAGVPEVTTTTNQGR